ncbi:MAG: hypothetical protein U0587_03935 [Candidatus Binatia bacterium]
MSKLLGIARERIFSPGKVDDDGAILETAARHLRDHGHAVTVFRADAPEWPAVDGVRLVFTMAQGAAAIARLQVWEDRGMRIVNSPAGILNCQRERTVTALARARVAFPPSVLMATHGDTAFPAWAAAGVWLKRGDVHATEAGDVTRVDDVAAARAVLAGFHARGIRTALVQRHVPGTVLKFYGVRQRFFHCVPPVDRPLPPAGVVDNIRDLGERAARALSVEIFGGDCVYDAAGAVWLIDLNDWPSYASCRADGGRAIAAYLHAQDSALPW